MAIVGVFIRENEAFLAYPKNGSTRQLNTILPPGVGEDTFFTDQESFRRAFDHITHFLEEREGIPQPEYILCIPDSFGMGDKTRILQFAGKCGIVLKRMITKTMAIGLALSFHDGVEGIFMVGYEKDNSYAKGMASIYDQTKAILEQQGIELIESTGVPFDVRYHYAVEHVTDPEMPPNTVKKIIQPGCMDHGEVIQPAYVVVAN